jgi:hypothetical protein
MAASSEYQLTPRDIFIALAAIISLGAIVLVVASYVSGNHFFAPNKVAQVAYIPTDKNPQDHLVTISGININHVTATTAQVSWITTSTTPVRLGYGTNESALFDYITVTSPTNSYTFSQLLPKTKYFFRLVTKTTYGQDVITPTFSFNTLAR